MTDNVIMELRKPSPFLVATLALLLSANNCQGVQNLGALLSAVKDCIVQAGGLNPSDIVEFGVDEDEVDYAELNYPWNILHELKTPVGYFTARTVRGRILMWAGILFPLDHHQSLRGWKLQTTGHGDVIQSVGPCPDHPPPLDKKEGL